jgi:hypothetical protein
MKNQLHEIATSFPCVYPNTGNGKPRIHLGNGNGNGRETSGNEIAFLETNRKRADDDLETRTTGKAPENRSAVSTDSSRREMEATPELVTEVMADFAAQLTKHQTP